MQNNRPEGTYKIQGFEWKVDFAGTQRTGVDQIFINGINFKRSRKRSIRLAGNPEVNVIAVRVKILYGVEQSSKGRPCRANIIGFQRRYRQRALLFEISIRFSKGIAVKVIFIVTDQREQPILFEIGGNDGLQRSIAEIPRECVACDLGMNRLEHPSIISEAILWIRHTLVIMTT